MRLLQLIILSLLLFFTSIAFSAIQAKEGDIVIFNMPLRAENMKVSLFVCQKSSCNVANKNELRTLGSETPILKPGEYFTYSLGSESKSLVGKTIYVAVYGVDEKQWSSIFTLIEKYKATEDPFYQFFCWSRKGTPPRFFCTPEIR